MRICGECGASNADAARFCNDCGKDLSGAVASTIVAPPVPPTVAEGQPPNTQPASRMSPMFAQKMATRMQELQGKRKADVLFVLDCTGSMGGEINAIRDAITGFADTIQSEGVRVRVGLIEFRDRLYNEEHRVLTFAGQVFTDDPVAFRAEVALLKAKGGGDEPESSLDALMLATQQPFDAEASKVIVLVTDAPPHIPDKETQSLEQVLAAMNQAQINQLYLVIRTQEESSRAYLGLLAGRKGLAFDLGKGDDFRQRAEDFKRTLMSLGKTISAATR